jgi:hypothetical protein
MKMWKRCSLGLAAFAGLTPGLWAQLPTGAAGAAAGAAGAAGGAGAAGAAIPAAAPAPTTIWSFLGLGPQSMADCKAKLCACPVGQLLSIAMLPYAALSGGLIHPLCPPNAPNPADMAKPADSAEGAAARIKADEAGAKARAAAVRYLGTVDCHYWPNVSEALCGALRKDKNECVRWEAAMALGRGCCCNKITIACLAIAVSGSERDGQPAETSERVKSAASFALENCLTKLASPVPLAPAETGPQKEGTLPPPKEGKGPAKETVPPPKPMTSLPPFYQQLDQFSMQQIAAFGRQALAKHHDAGSNPIVHPTEGHSLSAIVSNSFGSRPVITATTSHVSPPVVVSTPMESVVTDTHLSPVPAPTAAVTTVMEPTPVASTPVAQVSHSAPATTIVDMPAPGSTAATVGQLVTVLEHANYPEQREWAADNLANVRWDANPSVVTALTTMAHSDTTPAVRAACVRSLGKMGANTPEVLNALRNAKRDGDLRVRYEADRALNKMKSPYQPARQVSSASWFGSK